MVSTDIAVAITKTIMVTGSLSFGLRATVYSSYHHMVLGSRVSGVQTLLGYYKFYPGIPLTDRLL